jgi:hypothetical protein
VAAGFTLRSVESMGDGGGQGIKVTRNAPSADGVARRRRCHALRAGGVAAAFGRSHQVALPTIAVRVVECGPEQVRAVRGFPPLSVVSQFEFRLWVVSRRSASVEASGRRPVSVVRKHGGGGVCQPPPILSGHPHRISAPANPLILFASASGAKFLTFVLVAGSG